MARRRVFSALLLSVTALVLANASKDGCPLNLAKGTTVLFVADPGDFSGTAEATFYLNNLQHKVEIPKGAAACADGFTGIIMEQPVAVFTTGIGPTAAALCVFDVVSACGPRIRDFFFSGTAGWSPQLGGVINNATCSQGLANPNTAGIVRTGDVCVSPFSVNWDCRKASWQMTAAGSPNECTFPAQQFTAANSDLFGQCQFTDVSQQELAFSDEVLAAAAARKDKLPVRNSMIQALDVDYWSRMSAGTGVNYESLSATAPPRVWGYKQCMEADSQYFWSGAPWDMVARAYVADAMNKGLQDTTYDQTNVIAVSAMEAIGVSMAMQRYNALASTRRRIPYTVVRGMSDWVHTPLINKDSGMWAAGPAVENLTEGFRYAIATASAVVLDTLQARCKRLVSVSASSPAHRESPKGKLCSYSINYS